MNNSFEALDIEELNKKMDEHNAQFLYQIPDNLAAVYKLSNNQFVIFPQHGKEGLLFKDESEMNTMIQSRNYPVETENNVFSQERDRIKNINQNLPYFLGRISTVLGMDLSLDYSRENFDYISQKVQKFGTRKILKEHFLEFGLLLGEILRVRNNGKWSLDPISTLNVYWIPFLRLERKNYKGTKNVAVFKMVNDFARKNKVFDLNRFFDQFEQLEGIGPVE